MRRAHPTQLALFPEPHGQGDPERCHAPLDPAPYGSPPDPVFDGETYEPERDAARLGSQLQAVRELMEDGEWRTLYNLAKAVGGSEAGVSARLRDLRKPRFGGHTIERRYIATGIWSYRLHVHRAPEARA